MADEVAALAALNAAATAPDAVQPDAQVYKSLLYCCGSQLWVKKLLARFPVADKTALFQASDAVEQELTRTDWLEAFAAHPRDGDVGRQIGRAKQPIKTWEAQEQKGTSTAAATTLDRLEELNNAYFDRFGYIYIVCATGKSADEMLQILESRIGNNLEQELVIAAAEQSKITKIRLHKLLHE
ncbi:TPA: hypothetical protein N0F65_005790 [Lagenidium giganteum]|uniref:2-oxo-4-hydroxy-4-carboxy-5-ureidoimidazoline decarboxylase n=1 Tax=Lagenidium giganteum TaxID=4803 RepID=A0AAV2YU81_9STRA|nr:TPA: hypothetical protein N0F65_005790 [Lagenidium giganteum]